MSDRIKRILNNDFSMFEERNGRFYSDGAWRTKEQIIARTKEKISPEYKKVQADKARELRRVAKIALERGLV